MGKNSISAVCIPTHNMNIHKLTNSDLDQTCRPLVGSIGSNQTLTNWSIEQCPLQKCNSLKLQIVPYNN